MKIMRRYIILILSISMLASVYGGSQLKKVATSAANWLKLETGTRAIGMGGAYVAMGTGISGVPYNPASIAFIDDKDGFFSQTQYIADITYNVLGFAQNMNQEGTDFIGVHIFSLNSGPMDVTTAWYPDGTGESFDFTGLCIRASYARRLTDRLRIGVTGKYIREQIYTTHMQTFAFDIGSNFNTGIYGFTFGMSISNLGPEAKFQGEGTYVQVPDTLDVTGQLQRITEPFPLPMTLRVGVSNNIVGPESELVSSDDHRLTVAVDAINPIDYVLYGTIGMEYAWREMLYTRVGFRMGHDTAKWSLGGGFRVNGEGYKIGLDYAYVNYDVLDFTHQFGINFEF
ncbi:MAG: hypothetical protein CMG64_07410 [Candidatus Marinimicrobia bacterium]|nr:hypothetical protein [Candidatus Neomarinimicrobiota bacterium]